MAGERQLQPSSGELHRPDPVDAADDRAKSTPDTLGTLLPLLKGFDFNSLPQFLSRPPPMQPHRRKVLQNSSPIFGFNAQSEKYVDLLEEGIADPAKLRNGEGIVPNHQFYLDTRALVDSNAWAIDVLIDANSEMTNGPSPTPRLRLRSYYRRSFRQLFHRPP